MLLKMLETKDGCNDGNTRKTYHEGETYEFSEALGSNFLGQGVAEVVVEEPAEKPEEPDDGQGGKAEVSTDVQIVPELQADLPQGAVIMVQSMDEAGNPVLDMPKTAPADYPAGATRLLLDGPEENPVRAGDTMIIGSLLYRVAQVFETKAMTPPENK